MDISTNSLNQPVSFYNKSTGNTINMAINEENIYGQNIFSSEVSKKESQKLATRPTKKPRKSKRLNTIDSDYLPDEASSPSKAEQVANNFFVEPEKISLGIKFKKAVEHFFVVTPVINYFFLKQKTKKIQKTVETLNGISQNVDDLLNTTVPYGEESNLYNDIAKNLNDAANLLGKANREL